MDKYLYTSFFLTPHGDMITVEASTDYVAKREIQFKLKHYYSKSYPDHVVYQSIYKKQLIKNLFDYAKQNC